MRIQFKKPKRYYIGNFLILFSLIVFFGLYFPILRLYLFPPTQSSFTPQSTGYAIFIPKIHASSKVIPNVDPFNEASYTKALQEGVAQAKGTALPGQNGTIFLFAHSSGPPWEQTYYNTLFLRLGELSLGDTIYIYHGTHRYLYKVVDKKVVWPNDVKYLKDTKKNQLILQTCTPIGTSLQRLLVFAAPES